MNTNTDAVPSPAFEAWASEEGINNFHFNHCWAAWQAALASVAPASKVQADHIADELREASRQFHNLTQGDPTVIIRPSSAEKRDAIVAAGERLRAALAASSSGDMEVGS